jgi:excisionase family DNA binding protein
LKTKPEKVWPEYVTTGTIAKYCGVSKVTVLRWIESRILKAFKIPGGQNRIHRDDFFAFTSRYDIPVKKYSPDNKGEAPAGKKSEGDIKRNAAD